MLFIKLFVSILVSLLTIQLVYSVSAYNKTIQLIQPDGDTLYAVIRGDEHRKWIGTLDGYTIFERRFGEWCYAMKDSLGSIRPSGYLAKNLGRRDASTNDFLQTIEKGISSRKTTNVIRSVKYKSNSQNANNPIVGQKKGLVILIGFTDEAFSLTRSAFDDLFNSSNYSGLSSGSVRAFFLENSSGQLDYRFDVVGPFAAANPMSYYGTNDMNGNDANPEALIKEAVIAASNSVDFSMYDNDNDGSVDNVHIIFAGFGEEAGASSSTIWSHKWELPDPLIYNGKKVFYYSCSPERRGNNGNKISSVGVHCHEFCHTLGAPDFYDTDYQENGDYEGTGKWDLMASGGWNNDGDTPAHINAYAKSYILGWAKVETLSEPKQIKLVCQSQKSGMCRIDTKTNNEFFLLENRQNKGFDSNLPYHGLLIYRIHSQMNFEKNDLNAGHPQKCYPLVSTSSVSIPNSQPSSYGNINSSGCPYPGSALKKSFSDETSPSSKSWSGQNSGFKLEDIFELDSMITFNFLMEKNDSSITHIADSIQLFSESFENGFPETWNQVNVSGRKLWSVASDSRMMGHGSYVFLNNHRFAIEPNMTKAILPSMDCSDFESVKVTFDYKCIGEGFINLYWRQGGIDSPVFKSESNVSWTNASLLINKILKEGQLVFEGVCDNEGEVCLDQIQMWGIPKIIMGRISVKHNQKNGIYLITGNTIEIHTNQAKGCFIQITTLDGHCLKKEFIREDVMKIQLEKGLYILSIGAKSDLVIIKD